MAISMAIAAPNFLLMTLSFDVISSLGLLLLVLVVVVAVVVAAAVVVVPAGPPLVVPNVVVVSVVAVATTVVVLFPFFCRRSRRGFSFALSFGLPQPLPFVMTLMSFRCTKLLCLLDVVV